MTEEQKEMVRETVDIEGFDYTFIHYCDFKEIKDKKFHLLVSIYRKAAKELEDYIQD